MAFLAFPPPADFSELKKQMLRDMCKEESKRDKMHGWHLDKDLTSNGGLQMRGRDHCNLSLLKVLEVIVTL